MGTIRPSIATRIVTGAQGGTVQSVSVYATNVAAAPANGFQVGIYTDSGGQPGRYVAASSIGSLVEAGWATAALSATLTPNTAYWLLYNGAGSNFFQQLPALRERGSRGGGLHQCSHSLRLHACLGRNHDPRPLAVFPLPDHAVLDTLQLSHQHAHGDADSHEHRDANRDVHTHAYAYLDGHEHRDANHDAATHEYQQRDADQHPNDHPRDQRTRLHRHR